jgi:hypothetical protein
MQCTSLFFLSFITTLLALALLFPPVVEGTVLRQIETVTQRASGGCTMREGPGDFSQNCIEVTYNGRRSYQVRGYIQAAKAPAFPATVCNVTVELFGQFADGTPYRASHLATECSAISLGASKNTVK